MRCDLCKKKTATVHLTQQELNRPEIQVHLCADCARDRKVDDPTGFSLADLLSSLQKK